MVEEECLKIPFNLLSKQNHLEINLTIPRSNGRTTIARFGKYDFIRLSKTHKKLVAYMTWTPLLFPRSVAQLSLAMNPNWRSNFSPYKWVFLTDLLKRNPESAFLNEIVNNLLKGQNLEREIFQEVPDNEIAELTELQKTK